MDKPKPKENVNYEEIIKSAQNYLDSFDNYIDDRDLDNTHYLMEEIMEEVFGENVFDWINEQMD